MPLIAELIAAPGGAAHSAQQAIGAIELARNETVRSRHLGHQPECAADRASTCCRRSSRRIRTAQVVLISGFGTLETAIEAVRAGAFDYISKPFNIAEVKRDRRTRARAGAARADAPRRGRRPCRRRPDRPHGADARRSTSRSPTPPTRRRRC